MKKQVLIGTVFSAAFAVGLSAQQTGSSGSAGSQSGSQTGTRGAQQQVTVTGCLQSGDMAGSATSTGTGSSTAGTTGAGSSSTGSTSSANRSSSSAAGSQFVLTNAQMSMGG